MNIRLAKPSDAGEIAKSVNRLILELGGTVLPLSEAEKMCARVISCDADGAVVVADDGDQLAGICTISFQRAIRTLGKYAIIQEMYIGPEHRNDGLGSRLVEAAVSEAARHGCKVVELGAPPDGEDAERFYGRVGFTGVGQRLRRVISSSG
ncbi:MAG: GNAT family N-acetyltransferase [Chloroflexi bacterium]|nr:GNAT family N-acetyltransferase [Chloroflexota bacterium]